jgi:hypothetical protein
MAKKVYLIWKDPRAPKTEDNWMELNGKEFREFCKTKASRNRYFIRMGDDVHDGSDIIFIEATKEQYDEWRKDYERHRYLVKLENENQVFSIDDDRSEEMLIEAALQLDENNPELIHITESARSRFRDLYFQLPELDKELLMTLLPENGLSLEKLAELYDSNEVAMKKRRTRLQHRIRRELGTNGLL